MWSPGRWPQRQRVGRCASVWAGTNGASRGPPKRCWAAPPYGRRGVPEKVEIDGCELPEDRLYDLEHDVWLRPEVDGEATIGILHSLGAFAGRFLTLAYRPVEGPLDRGRSVATLESYRFTGAVRLPVDGTPVARNPRVVERPKLLNVAP